jgi:hypothetical protein
MRDAYRNIELGEPQLPLDFYDYPDPDDDAA